MKSLNIAFAESTISIDYGEGRPTEIVEFLFFNLAQNVVNSSDHRFRLEEGADGLLKLFDGHLMVQEHNSPAEMADQLLNRVCYHLADMAKQTVLVHAAAIHWRGQGIVFPGHTGAGKSTLATWMTTRGAEYLTDELALISEDFSRLQGFHRPIVLKGEARSIFREIIEVGIEDSAAMRGRLIDLLSPDRLKETSCCRESTLDFVIFPKYCSDTASTLMPLSKAEGAYKLVNCLANIHNLQGEGLHAAIHIARSIPIYQLKFKRLDQAEQLIDRIYNE